VAVDFFVFVFLFYKTTQDISTINPNTPGLKGHIKNCLLLFREEIYTVSSNL